MIIIIMFVFLLKENNKNKIHCTAAINTDLRCELKQSSYYLHQCMFVFCFLRAVNIVTQNASAERTQVMRTHSCVRAESILNTFGMHFLFACLWAAQNQSFLFMLFFHNSKFGSELTKSTSNSFQSSPHKKHVHPANGNQCSVTFRVRFLLALYSRLCAHKLCD